MPQDPLPAPTPKLGKGMLYVAWLLALALLTWGFSGWLDKARNPNQHPVSVTKDDAQEVRLLRNRYGHYHASGRINGQAVEFMLDTGATSVAVPDGLAARLGLSRGPAVDIQTANGRATAYATRLDSLQLGEIEVRDVRAHISPSMDGEEVLLGMSVLKQLDFNQQGDTLTLRLRSPNP
jgi:aspartyl protease family protein